MGDPSKLKYQKRAQFSKPTGLLVNCPESVLKVREISTQKLWHDLYAHRSYTVKRTDGTLFLKTVKWIFAKPEQHFWNYKLHIDNLAGNEVHDCQGWTSSK